MKRQFCEINGNWVNAENVCGYCFYYKGMLTDALMHTHGCTTKFNGEPCGRLLRFRTRPITNDTMPRGDDYRQMLKKRKRK